MPLSKETTDQIRKEAEDNANNGGGNADYADGRLDGYEDGATAWAIWKKKAEGYEKALKEIRDYQPYPKTVFIEIEPGQFKEIGIMLEEKFGMSIDRFSGYIGRMLIKGNQEIATKALEQNKVK